MYCEHCGKRIDEVLNYCNGCGGQLKKKTREPQSLAGNMVSAMAATTIFGLIILGVLIGNLLDKVSRTEPLFVFAMVYLIVLFGICYMVMKQVSKLIDADLKSREFPQRSSTPAVQLPPRSTNQLDEFREPASVTDHTTRTLESSRIADKS
jgi:F0F1-type ATP synthase assembly protein I